jgi:hypothetical protein
MLMDWVSWARETTSRGANKQEENSYSGLPTNFASSHQRLKFSQNC